MAWEWLGSGLRVAFERLEVCIGSFVTCLGALVNRSPMAHSIPMNGKCSHSLSTKGLKQQQQQLTTARTYQNTNLKYIALSLKTSNLTNFQLRSSIQLRSFGLKRHGKGFPNRACSTCFPTAATGDFAREWDAIARSRYQRRLGAAVCFAAC